MLSSDKITEIFFVIDEFCKNFNEVVSAHTIKQDNGKKTRNRKSISGDISSLAVAKDYRRKGIGKSLLKSAVSHFQSDVLKFTNVDCDCESVTGFLSSLGLTPKGQQFEMVRKI